MILSIMTKNISWSEFLFVKSLVMWNILFIFATQNYTDTMVVRAKNGRIRIEIFVADRAFGIS